MRGGLAAGAAVPGIVRRRLQAGARTHAGIAAVDRGIEQFGQRRSDRLNVVADAPWISGFCRAFLGVSGFFAIRRIWDESASEKRANGLVRDAARRHVSRCQQADFGTAVPYAVSGSVERLDDIQMDPAATGASHGPVFGAGAAGDDAQDRERGAAIRTVREHRRRLQGLFGEGREIGRPARGRPLRRWRSRIREPRLETIDMGFRVRDRRLRIRPRETDFEGRKRQAIDHHRFLVGPLNPGVP